MGTTAGRRVQVAGLLQQLVARTMQLTRGSGTAGGCLDESSSGITSDDGLTSAELDYRILMGFWF
ncbi:hypothetical protein [Marinifilum sp.]|uniref:hypothetical protein n=1 Tax=Marinifilum sp. TaxID=2033137 RepID=UPI003BA95D85